MKPEEENLNEEWRLPKKIELPKEVAEFLINTLDEHLKETNKNFGHLLDKDKEEAYTNHGEFLQVDEKTKTVCLFIKTGKMWSEPN